MTAGDYVGIVAGLIVTVGFFYLGIRIGKRNRTRPVLRYCSDFDRLVRADDGILSGGIVVTQGGHEVKSISRTCIALWNHRGDTISRSDVLPTDPLRFSLEGDDKVIQARVLSRSRPQNGFDIELGKDGQVIVEFDFLDSEDGAVVEIIHQGDRAVVLAGTVRGSTMERHGDADLSIETLKRLANFGYWKRFFQYWWNNRENKYVFVAGLVASIVGTPALFINWVISEYREPRIVPLEGRNLQTIEGQSDFASEVSRVGLSPNRVLFWILVPMTLLLASMFMWILLSRPRTSVPNAILSDFRSKS